MILFGNNANNKKLINILFVFSFVSIFIILFNKCKYGYADVDETFYIQMAHRIAQGDALIAEEWNTTLGFSYLLYPVMRVYMLLFNSFDGIVLNFRYIYLIVWSILTIYLYFEIRKYTYLGAYFSSLFLFIYAPYNIMALSYNSMGIMFLILSCTTCLTRNSKISNIVAGSFYSFSVLCHPTLAIMVIYYLIYFLFIKKDKKQLLYFSIGIVIQFIIFCIFAFSRTSLSKILLSIPKILNAPDHGTSSAYSLQTTWINIWKTYSNPIIILTVILVTIVSYFCKNKVEYFIIVLILITVLLFNVYQNFYYINYMIYPFVIGAPFILQLKSKRIKDFIFCFCISGIIYSFCVNWVSNQGPYAVFSVLSIASVGCICAFSTYVEELDISKRKLHKLAKITLCIVLFLQLFLELDVRWKTIYWDADMDKQNVVIDIGPEKGIHVSESKYREYMNVIDVSKSFKYEGNYALFLSSQSLYYLDNNELRCSAYSAWLIPNDSRQTEYYDINPNMIPDLIVYPSSEYGKYDELLDFLMTKNDFVLDIQNKDGCMYIKNSISN